MANRCFYILICITAIVNAFNERRHQNVKTTMIMNINSIPKSNTEIMSKTVKNSFLKVLPLFVIPTIAKAGLFTSEEQDIIDDISTFQKPINEVIDQLKPNLVPNAVGVYTSTVQLKGGKEDSDVVRSYMEVYIKPLQLKMEKSILKLSLKDSAENDRMKLLPSIMKGHIFELTQAIDEMKATNQLKELEEVQETLAEFLKLASSKYQIKPFIPSRPLTDAELFGPLGCEFWGKKRVPGSNACIEIKNE